MDKPAARLSLSVRNAVLDAQPPRSVKLHLTTRQGAHVNVSTVVKTIRMESKKRLEKLEKSAKSNYVNGKKFLRVKSHTAQHGDVNSPYVKKTAVVRKIAKKMVKKLKKSVITGEINEESNSRVMKHRKNHQDLANARPMTETGTKNKKPKKAMKKQKPKKLKKRSRNLKRKPSQIKVFMLSF